MTEYRYFKPKKKYEKVFASHAILVTDHNLTKTFRLDQKNRKNWREAGDTLEHNLNVYWDEISEKEIFIEML